MLCASASKVQALALKVEPWSWSWDFGLDYITADGTMLRITECFTKSNSLKMTFLSRSSVKSPLEFHCKYVVSYLVPFLVYSASNNEIWTRDRSRSLKMVPFKSCLFVSSNFAKGHRLHCTYPKHLGFLENESRQRHIKECNACGAPCEIVSWPFQSYYY